MRKENKNCRRQAAKTRQPINACSSREMKIRRIFMVLPRSECARGRHRRERALEPPPIRVMMIRNPRKRFAPTHQRATSQPNNQGDSKSHTFQDSLETCNQQEDKQETPREEGKGRNDGLSTTPRGRTSSLGYFKGFSLVVSIQEGKGCVVKCVNLVEITFIIY